MTIVAVAGGLVLGLLLVAWLGTRMLRSGDTVSSGASGMFGNLIDVFDPARGRADRDIQEDEHKTEVTPTPAPHERPMRVDLRTGRATVRRTPHA